MESTLTIVEVDHESQTLYARTINADAASGELVLGGTPTAEEIREAANDSLAAPEIGDYSTYSVNWSN